MLGLIDIALIRNCANAMGIYEIRQTDTNVLLFVKEIKSPKVIELLSRLNGRAMLSAGNKPYITIRCGGGSSLDMLKKVFKI